MRWLDLNDLTLAQHNTPHSPKTLLKLFKMLRVFRIDLVNGEKYNSFDTNAVITVNNYKQFKSDCEALFSRIHKEKVIVLLHYILISEQ